MRKVKIVSVFVLLAVLLSAGSGMALAQEPPPASSNVASTIARQEPPQPLSWARLGGDHWEFPWSGGRLHRLAVWSFPYCYGQQYHGPGGYQDTCSSSHGCIDQWTWWLTYPESKLGVPFGWAAVLWKRGRRNINNYSAVCWVY